MSGPGRDPLSPTKFENDFTLSGFKPQQKKSYGKPTHIAQTEQPWRRLHHTDTLASTRRGVCHELQAINDSLDLHLNSVYDHHKDCFWTKNQVLYQKEDTSEDQKKQEDTQEKEEDIRVWVDPQRRSIYSIK